MEFTYDENIMSDLHKDAYGFRPSGEFWSLWESASNEEKQHIWDDTLVVLQRNIAAEEEAEALQMSEFEARIKDAIGVGATDRGAAIRWIVESLELSEIELCYGGEYACFQLGLPFSYSKELDVAVAELQQS